MTQLIAETSSADVDEAPDEIVPAASLEPRHLPGYYLG